MLGTVQEQWDDKEAVLAVERPKKRRAGGSNTVLEEEAQLEVVVERQMGRFCSDSCSWR